MTLRYFTNRAPDSLPIRPAAGIQKEWVDKFDRSEISIPAISSPAISFVDFIDLGDGFGVGPTHFGHERWRDLFCCLHGKRFCFSYKLGTSKEPAALRVFDWDNDGFLDILVADLVPFSQLITMRAMSLVAPKLDQSKTFEPFILLEGLGRVASLELGDLNDDGRADLLVARVWLAINRLHFWDSKAKQPH